MKSQSESEKEIERKILEKDKIAKALLNGSALCLIVAGVGLVYIIAGSVLYYLPGGLEQPSPLFTSYLQLIRDGTIGGVTGIAGFCSFSILRWLYWS